jgi:hypothetical protein
LAAPSAGCFYIEKNSTWNSTWRAEKCMTNDGSHSEPASALVGGERHWALARTQAAAARSRRRDADYSGRQKEWLLALDGVPSMVFGVLLMMFPGAGALALVLWIGAYIFVAGCLLVALGLRLRTWGRGYDAAALRVA